MPQAHEDGEKSDTSLISASDLVLAVGGNMASSFGPPLETVRNAIEILSQRGASIRAMSACYNTPAFPAGNGPDFVNAAVRLTARWSPDRVLEICHDIEGIAGRTRETRWGQRTLDLDVIAMGDLVLPNAETFATWHGLPMQEQMVRTPEELILPHPRMHERAFVLVPMADVAANWVHPILGDTVQEMLDALDPALKEEVRRIE